MRITIALLGVLLLLPARLSAQQEPLSFDSWCFGVKLDRGHDCPNFAIVELGLRSRVTGQTDHSTRDPAHAYPVLAGHGFVGAGYARRVGSGAALGIVAELGAGDARQSVGLRYDQMLGHSPIRLDLGTGVIRVETHQRGVTRRRMAGGTFVEGAVRASDLFIVQMRVEKINSSGTLVKPASAMYLGARMEGAGAVKTTAVVATVYLVAMWVLYFTSGD